MKKCIFMYVTYDASSIMHVSDWIWNVLYNKFKVLGVPSLTCIVENKHFWGKWTTLRWYEMHLYAGLKSHFRQKMVYRCAAEDIIVVLMLIYCNLLRNGDWIWFSFFHTVSIVLRIHNLYKKITISLSTLYDIIPSVDLFLIIILYEYT